MSVHIHAPVRWTRHARRRIRGSVALITGKVAAPWWWRLYEVNRVLVVAGVGLLVTCGGRPLLGRITRGSAPVVEPVHRATLQDDPNSALRGALRPELFRAGGREQGSAGRANVSVAELTRSVKLLGILGGATPRAIILHLPTQQVHYAVKGQFVGPLEVVEVRATSVVLAWEKESLELNL